MHIYISLSSKLQQGEQLIDDNSTDSDNSNNKKRQFMISLARFVFLLESKITRLKICLLQVYMTLLIPVTHVFSLISALFTFDEVYYKFGESVQI